MRVEGSVTTVSWIPLEAETGVAVTPCLVAVAEPAAIDPELLRQVASRHRGELDQVNTS